VERVAQGPDAQEHGPALRYAVGLGTPPRRYARLAPERRRSSGRHAATRPVIETGSARWWLGWNGIRVNCIPDRLYGREPATPAERVVAFYNTRGRCSRPILPKEARGPVQYLLVRRFRLTSAGFKRYLGEMRLTFFG
jgi:hypothetical protein